MPMIFSARLLFAAAIVGGTLLSGCTSLPATPYCAAAAGDGTYGYSTMQIEGDIYRIDFHGSPATASRTARAFAFYRAAELAGELGVPAFKIVQGEVDRCILDRSHHRHTMHKRAGRLCNGGLRRRNGERRPQLDLGLASTFPEDVVCRDAHDLL